MEWLLTLLDRLAGVCPTEQDKPVLPPLTVPAPEGQPAAPSGLKEFYKEIHGDMRALRDTELKITALFYQVAAFLFAGNLALAASNSPAITWQFKGLVTAWSIIFLLVFWCMVHGRIAHDNKSYSYLMAHKRMIDEHWFGSSFAPRPKHLGSGPSGPGYRKTQKLLAWSSLGVLGALGLTLAHTIPPLCWRTSR